MAESHDPRSDKERKERMSEFDDLKSHQEMWANFIRLTVWSCVAIAGSLVLLALFLL